MQCTGKIVQRSNIVKGRAVPSWSLKRFVLAKIFGLREKNSFKMRKKRHKLAICFAFADESQPVQDLIKYRWPASIYLF